MSCNESLLSLCSVQLGEAVGMAQLAFQLKHCIETTPCQEEAEEAIDNKIIPSWPQEVPGKLKQHGQGAWLPGFLIWETSN